MDDSDSGDQMSVENQIILEPVLQVAPENAGLFVSRGQGTHPTRIIKSYELIFVQQGALGIREEQTDFVVRAGETLVLFPGRRHAGIEAFPPDLRFYWMHFTMSASERAYSTDGVKLYVPQHRVVRRPDRVVELFRWFLDDQEAGFLDGTSKSLILTMILKEVSESSPSSYSVDRASYALAGKADEHIRTHFHQEISTSVIASHLRCNPDYLGRVYREVYGRTPTDAIQMRRLGHARQMLLDGDRNVDEIARLSGFPDPGYFRRLFKRSEGMTPGAYRRLYGRAHINTH